MVLTYLKVLYAHDPSNKVINLRKRKIHVTHHCMPTGIYAHILSHAC